jgi:hypothetical protein
MENGKVGSGISATSAPNARGETGKFKNSLAGENSSRSGRLDRWLARGNFRFGLKLREPWASAQRQMKGVGETRCG